MAGNGAAESESLRVFISYRRSDCQPQANGLNDGLRHRLPGARVFMDIDSIPFGVDFEQHIREEIRSCDVVLVLIGDQWLDVADAAGQRRVDDPQDFVRLEIESALASPDVRVVPVLVENALMPSTSALPSSIARLARLNAIELSDRRWQSDLERLAGVVEEIGTGARPAGRSAASTVGLYQLDAEALRAAVAAMPGSFQTKDVSESAAAAHGYVAEARNYHSMVGSWISRNAGSLQVSSAGKSNNSRGERWQRDAGPAVRVPRTSGPSVFNTAVHAPLLAGRATAPPDLTGAPTGSRPSAGERAVQVLMILLPALSFSFAAWVPPLWAAGKRRRLQDRARARRLSQFAALIAGLLVLFVIMLAVSPSPEEGSTPAGIAIVGVLAFFGAMGFGTYLAFVERGVAVGAPATGSGPWLPGAEGPLAMRQLRARYRQAAAEDPALAREMGVGRPDRPRLFDDGGLLDLNSLPAVEIGARAQLSEAQVRALIMARERFGRLSSIEDLVVHADLDPAAAERLRDYAVFV